MKLSEINYKLTALITEGYGRSFKFRYTGDEVNDPRPNALSLGNFRSSRGNNLVSGINLNYLSDRQLLRLRQNLPHILKDKNLRRRVRKLRALMPDVFNSAYRTYKKDEMNNVDPGVLKYDKDSTQIKTSEPPKPKTVKPTQVAKTMSNIEKDDDLTQVDKDVDTDDSLKPPEQDDINKNKREIAKKELDKEIEETDSEQTDEEETDDKIKPRKPTSPKDPIEPEAEETAEEGSLGEE